MLEGWDFHCCNLKKKVTELLAMLHRPCRSLDPSLRTVAQTLLVFSFYRTAVDYRNIEAFKNPSNTTASVTLLKAHHSL